MVISLGCLTVNQLSLFISFPGERHAMIGIANDLFKMAGEVSHFKQIITTPTIKVYCYPK